MVAQFAIHVCLLACAIASQIKGVAAKARQVELVQFGATPDGVLLDINRSPTRMSPPAPMSEVSPLALDRLREDFAVIAPHAQPLPAQVAEQSAIPVPRWMQPGGAAATAFETATAPSAARIPSPMCFLSPYRPRGDLSALVEHRWANLYPLISAVACEVGVPVGLFDALIAQESGYDPMIVAPTGAVGLTQLMPGTAARLGCPTRAIRFRACRARDSVFTKAPR